jgi:hypothetical protein
MRAGLPRVTGALLAAWNLPVVNQNVRTLGALPSR